MAVLINYQENYNLALAQALKSLQNNSLAIVPTETVYGLAGRALSSDATKKIYQIKKRPSDNPLILHVSSYTMAKKYGIFPSINSVEMLIEKYWPGPLTLIVPSSTLFFGETGLPNIAIRFSSHPFLIDLMASLDEPLFIPSANLSGEPSSTCLEMIPSEMESQVECIIFGESSEYGLESTVISLLQPYTWTLLRPGKISKNQIQAILKDFSLENPNKQTILSPGTRYPHYKPKGVEIFTFKSISHLKPYLHSDLKQRMIVFSQQSIPFSPPDLIHIQTINQLIHQFYYFLFKAEKDQIQQLFFFIHDGEFYPDLWDRLQRATDHMIGF